MSKSEAPTQTETVTPLPTPVSKHNQDFEIRSVEGMSELIRDIRDATTIEDWSYILADYLSWGNTKISDETAIFNMNSAHDCPNRGTQESGESETGLCQVPWDMCYAGKAERVYKQSLPYRRRQEYLWDCLDPQTFAKAFVRVVERKIKWGNIDSLSEVDLRLSEAGDFRTNQDVYKADEIARILENAGIGAVYTYSASFKLTGWFEQHVDNLTVMQSVDRSTVAEWLSDEYNIGIDAQDAEYGHKRYNAFTLTEETIEEADTLANAAPDGHVWCPHDLEKRQKGIPGEEAIQCGDCRLCLEKDGPDVAIPLHS